MPAQGLPPAFVGRGEHGAAFNSRMAVQPRHVRNDGSCVIEGSWSQVEPARSRSISPIDRGGRTERVDLLRDAVRQVRNRHPFESVAWVVLPDHLHAVWTLPAGDADYSTRWSLIKAKFSHAIPRGEFVGPARLRKGERGIWQHRFWEHLVRDEDDLQRQVDYVHFNPVKHGHVSRAEYWPYSSIHGYIRSGMPALDVRV